MKLKKTRTRRDLLHPEGHFLYPTSQKSHELAKLAVLTFYFIYVFFLGGGRVLKSFLGILSDAQNAPVKLRVGYLGEQSITHRHSFRI